MLDLDPTDGPRRLVAIDAETTGHKIMTAEQVRRAPKGLRLPGLIIEIGCVELLREPAGWRKGETWQTRINPDAPINPTAIRIHGIKPGDLKQAPRFDEILPAFLAFIGESDLVAHAYRNEKQFFDYEMARVKRIRWDEEAFPEGRFICTQELYAEMFPGAPKSLDAMTDRLWLDRSERFTFHGALLDADLTADAYIELERRRRTSEPEPDAPRSAALD
ncbi:MAG: exonuclease domain-containing protein [Rhodospirillaceae bacterium]